MQPQEKPRKKIYFGWWIVVAGFVIMALSYAPNFAMLGLFIKPLATDFGVARTASTVIAVIGSVSGMVASLFVGKFLARQSLRKMAVIALVLQALNYVGYALAGTFTVILITAFLSGIFNLFITTLPMSILINNWFGSKIRGRAWSITMVGSGVGSMLLTPVTGVIIENLGWRWGYGFFGVLSLLLIPLVLVTFVRHPRNKGLAVLGEAETTADGKTGPQKLDTSGIPAKSALKTGMFWTLIIAIVLLAGSVQSWNIHAAPLLSDQGFDTIQVSFLVSISSMGSIAGKLILGVICDKKGTQYGVLFSAVILMLGLLISFFSAGLPWLAYPMMALGGAGMAINAITVPLMTRDLFGIREYSTLAGFTESSLKFGAALMPLGASMVYDVVGNYTPAISALLVFCVVGVVLIFSAYAMRPKAMEKYRVM